MRWSRKEVCLLTGNSVLDGAVDQSHVFVTFSVLCELFDVFQGAVETVLESSCSSIVNWGT